MEDYCPTLKRITIFATDTCSGYDTVPVCIDCRKQLDADGRDWQPEPDFGVSDTDKCALCGADFDAYHAKQDT